MKKLRTILITAIFILAAAGLLIMEFLSNRVTENPMGTVGNTGGNLLNNGLFCESEGIVYFANPYDEDTLYSMNVNETNLKKLGTVGVQSINAAGNFIYYYQKGTNSGSGLGFVVRTTGVYRVKKNGNDGLCLKRDPAGIITLIDNSIYYQHYTNATGTILDRISIDKSEEETIFPYMVSPASAYYSNIYYANPDASYYLYAYDTRYKTNSLLHACSVWNPIYEDNYIYYMDIESDYQLHRYNLSTMQTQVLTTDRVDTYNVYGDYIYYQKNSQTDPALMRMRIDGSEPELVLPGNYQNINITSQYVYFNAYDTPTPVYRQAVYGAVNVTTFNPSVEK